MIFEVLLLFTKVFSMKLGGMASFGSDTSKQIAKVFSMKMLFPPNCESFLPGRFPAIRYSLTEKVVAIITHNMQPIGIQWNLRIKDTLGAGFLSLIRRLSSGGRFDSICNF